MLKSNILNNLKTRGFINDCTDLMGLDNLLSTSKITCYIGYDATASSLHVGHLMNIMMLRWFQKDGHRVITLLGGGTTKIGDPSFRKTERPLITDKTIDANLLSLKSIFSKYLNFSSDYPGALMLNNDEWLSKLNYLDFLRDTGKHFSINRMLSFESVKSRLEKNDPLSFLEFNYMIFQAYDFYYLNKYYNCSLQMGGSDQWGNIVSGIDLVKKISKKNAYAITSPLITNSDGSKMGKTADGAVWLDEKKLSDYDFFQFWRNVDDRNVGKFLKLFTKLPLKEIDKLAKLEGAEINEAKKILSFEVTKIARGYNEANNALQISENTFNEKIIDERLNSIEIKSIDLVKSLFNLIDAVEKLNLVKSRSEIKRLIKSNGIKVNDETFNDKEFSLKNWSDPLLDCL